MRRLLIGPALVVAFVLGNALVDAEVGTRSAEGSLEVREHVEEPDAYYIEGYLSFLRLRSTTSGDVAVARTFRDKIRLNVEVPVGHYRLIRYIRPCAGNCDLLDGKTERCAIGVRITRRSKVHAVVRTQMTEPCEFRLESH